MYERFPRTTRATSAAVLGLLVAGCGVQTGAPGEKPSAPDVTSVPTNLTPPAVPTPTETRKLTLESRQITDGGRAFVCNAVAAIANPDETWRVIGRPIVWDKGVPAPVEILNMSSAGIKVEERNPLPTDWYDLNGEKTTEDKIACNEVAVFTEYNPKNNNQIVTTVDELPVGFRADASAIHDQVLTQHDMGPLGKVELQEFLEHLR